MEKLSCPQTPSGQALDKPRCHRSPCRRLCWVPQVLRRGSPSPEAPVLLSQASG